LEKDFGELIGRIHAPKSGNSSYKAV
jgi:hypothetical protein